MKVIKQKRSFTNSFSHSLQQLNQHQEPAQIQQLLSLLAAYEQVCIKRSDFDGAESVKIKIQQIKQQNIILTNKMIESSSKVNIQQICKQNQAEISHFQSYWDKEMESFIKNIQERQQQYKKQQAQSFQKYIQNLKAQQIPRVKYSSIILEKRRHLTNLIKARHYKEAQAINVLLKIMEAQEEEKWIKKYDQILQSKIQKFKKKQVLQLQALQLKLQNLFHQKIKERDSKYEILLKRNRKRLIEINKSSSQERLRTLSNSKAFCNAMRSTEDMRSRHARTSLNKSYQK